MKEILEQVEKCKQAKGIAFTYLNDGKEMVMLNPDWVSMHAEAMAIVDHEGKVVTVDTYPLVFKNRYAAEGAYAMFEVIHPAILEKYKIGVYNKDGETVAFNKSEIQGGK